ncbi:hypothetical protein [Zooshikella ganghwensis]|uniref:hypothetical protein n=1 Tax=Zooshikella ganghwensis TaxID=202772 RepID=UPI0003F4C0B4|nr:hypothetical protein [Zooshikella ganghwensis]
MSYFDIKNKLQECFDSKDSSLIFKLLDELISNPEPVEIKEFSEVLLDLIFSLSDFYEKLDKNRSGAIFEWVKQRWSEDDAAYLDILLSILANLNTSGVDTFINQRIAETKSYEARNLLIDFASET